MMANCGTNSAIPTTEKEYEMRLTARELEQMQYTDQIRRAERRKMINQIAKAIVIGILLFLAYGFIGYLETMHIW